MAAPRYRLFSTEMKLSRRSILLLLFLFAASGASALIYEIVWFQLLELVIGSSAVSLGLLLAMFMGGTCLGSIGFPRLIPDRWNPLRVYAVVEFGIALSAIAVLLALPFASGWYVSIGDYGEWDVLVRALLCGICLLPPSLLIGATFPAIARVIAPSIPHISWMGYFYGVNIAGAVAGSMAAGFYLLRVHDMYIATYVAAAINLLTGGIAFGLAPSTRGLPSSEMSGVGAKGHSRIYLVIALSGLTALGGEVVWTRLLSLSSL